MWYTYRQAHGKREKKKIKHEGKQEVPNGSHFVFNFQN
jgi:hypothetical protein